MAGMRADIVERAAQVTLAGSAQQDLLFIETLQYQFFCHCHVVICKQPVWHVDSWQDRFAAIGPFAQWYDATVHAADRHICSHLVRKQLL